MDESLNQPSSVKDDCPMGCKLLLYGNKAVSYTHLSGAVADAVDDVGCTVQVGSLSHNFCFGFEEQDIGCLLYTSRCV